jgi:carboxyl-terminal processing protease
MRTSKASLSRLLLLPAIVGLVTASVIVGYAGSDLWGAGTRGHGHRVQTAWFFPQSGGSDSDSGDSAQADDPLDNYKTALSLLKKEYYGPPIDAPKTQQLTYEAIRGMLDSLKDQFTSFLDPEDWSQMQATTRGDFEGIGALLQQDETTKMIKVVRPIETSPAEKVGIKADDEIVRVDGKSVIGKNLNDVVGMIKGKSGTVVHLTIVRGKKTVEFTIRRALVEPPIVKYWMEDTQAKIGHIVLTDFNEKSIEQMDKAFSDLERQGMRALIFDLRGNPGGLLNVAIDVASVFIPSDQNKEMDNAVVWVKEGSGKEQAYRLKESEFTHPRIPLVVLTNGSSASASEIVSGAIKDYGVGTLIGERTFGKGLVQSLFSLDDNSALRLTTAKYYTPKHTDINRKRDSDGDPIPGSGGIVPDIEIKQSSKWKEDFKDKTNDLQLQKAIQFLRARLNGESVAQATAAIHQSQ